MQHNLEGSAVVDAANGITGWLKSVTADSVTIVRSQSNHQQLTQTYPLSRYSLIAKSGYLAIYRRADGA